MFNNIGGKLKGLAYFTAVGGVSIFGIIAFVILFTSPISSISFFVLAVSCLFSSWPIYGLGEMIESSSSTELLMKKIIAQQVEQQKVISTKKEESAEPLNPCNKRFFVKNYYPGLPVQAVELQLICKENREVFVDLDFYCYLNTPITAVNADIEFTTVFGDKWVFKDIPCSNLKSDGLLLHTNEQFIQLDLEKVQSIKSVSVRICKYISDDNIIVNSMQAKEITLSDNELSDLKYMAGINAVTPCLDTEYGWTCICGTENDQGMAECKLCGKSRLKNMDSDRGDLNILLEKLEILSNAREMEEYLVEYNKKYHNEGLAHFISKFNDTVQFERLYGNQKQSALKIIKKELGFEAGSRKDQRD